MDDKQRTARDKNPNPAATTSTGDTDRDRTDQPDADADDLDRLDNDELAERLGSLDRPRLDAAAEQAAMPDAGSASDEEIAEFLVRAHPDMARQLLRSDGAVPGINPDGLAGLPVNHPLRDQGDQDRTDPGAQDDAGQPTTRARASTR